MPGRFARFGFCFGNPKIRRASDFAKSNAKFEAFRILREFSQNTLESDEMSRF